MGMAWGRAWGWPGAVLWEAVAGHGVLLCALQGLAKGLAKGSGQALGKAWGRPGGNALAGLGQGWVVAWGRALGVG